MTARSATLPLLVALLVGGCGDTPVAGTRPALAPLPIHVVEPRSGDVGRVWDGVVEAVQHADLSAQTAGRIAAVHADVGDRVAQGDTLLQITAFEQQAGAAAARAQLRAAEASAVEAESSYRRFASLAEKQHVSRAQLDQVRAARDSAIAARDAARAALDQAGRQTVYTVVQAPFSGVVSTRRVEPGETVAPGQSLISVFAPDALRIELLVPQSDADAIRASGRAQILLSDSRRLDAARVVVFPTADPVAHSVGIRVVLPEEENPPSPGVTARVVFPIAGDTAALRIPAAALVQRGEISSVYVVDENRIGLRQLRLGRRVDDQVEVLAGVKPGERIVTDPVAGLQALIAQRKRTAHD